MSANLSLVQICFVSMVYSLTSSTAGCLTLKHPAAAFLVTSLTSRHCTSTISLWCQIITIPFSKAFPITLIHNWLIRHQSMVSSTTSSLMAGQPSQGSLSPPLQSCLLLRKSLTIIFSMASSSPPPVQELHHCIWCPKSQLHGVPCGNYCGLDDITTPDRYPIPHIQDFRASLHRATIFSKVDLVWALNQILVHKDDAPKTAIIALFGIYE